MDILPVRRRLDFLAFLRYVLRRRAPTVVADVDAGAAGAGDTLDFSQSHDDDAVPVAVVHASVTDWGSQDIINSLVFYSSPPPLTRLAPMRVSTYERSRPMVKTTSANDTMRFTSSAMT